MRTQLSKYSIADIALNFPHSIKILNRYELDYSCHGRDNFAEACIKAQLDPQQVWKEIEMECDTQLSHLYSFKLWETQFLIDFIVNSHHDFITARIPSLKKAIAECVKECSTLFPEVIEIAETFETLEARLLEHLPIEEHVLFPAIRRMTTRQMPPNTPLQTNIQKPVTAMESEHNAIADLLKLLRILTDHYHAPANATPWLHTLYDLLEEFDRDLNQHMHIENNILFPKVKL